MKISIAALAVTLCASALVLPVRAQDAKQIVQQAVNTELAAARNDQSHWRYLKTEGGGSSWVVVETEHGAIGRHVDVDGRPASEATLAADDAHNQKFIHDPAMQQKQKQNGAHDDKQAAELLGMMPQAFLWKVVSETPKDITLHYVPNPNFHPPNMEARVMGNMTGTLVVDRAQHRIKTFKGVLHSDVAIGFGILARLKQGGTFDIERRELVPGIWQITQTHVNINGHALFFHTISEHEDQVKTDMTPVPPGTTLEQAVKLLDEPLK